MDPDKTLVNDRDFDGSEIGQGLSGNSWGELDRGQRGQRGSCGSDSDDSSDFSIDNNEDSDSDEEGDEGEALLEARGDPQLDWRRSLPDYHRETLTVLDQISEVYSLRWWVHVAWRQESKLTIYTGALEVFDE